MVNSETLLCNLQVSQSTIVEGNNPVFRYYASNSNTIGYKKLKHLTQAQTFNQRLLSSNNNYMHGYNISVPYLD